MSHEMEDEKTDTFRQAEVCITVRSREQLDNYSQC
jgi:hypothetical protein